MMHDSQRPSSPVVVYSQDSYPPHPDFIIYTVVAGAFAYARARRIDNADVEIRLFPLGFREFFLGIMRKFLRTGATSYFTFASAAASGEVRDVNIDGTTLRVLRYSAVFPVLSRVLKCLWHAAIILGGCLEKGSFRGSRFLNASYRGVRVGDLVASESLRFSGSEISSLRCSRLLVALLIDAILICDLCFDEILLTPTSAVFALEPTYRHSVYKRALRARGADVIEKPAYDSHNSFRIVGASEELAHPEVAKASTGLLSGDERKQIEAYMLGRLASPGDYLPYMSHGFNRNENEDIRSEDGVLVSREQAKANVVVFLHSFDDVQYFFGGDGYSDLLEWADVTIRTCLANANVGQILIKGHPCPVFATYPKSERSERWLRRRYANEPRVIWIDRCTSLRAIASLPYVTGITHHGSVAEELVFLRVPVIGWRNATWRDGYSFVRTWEIPSEFERLLSELSVDTYTAVSNEELESLAHFIREYRLRPYAPMDGNAYWYGLWKESAGQLVALRDEETLGAELSSLDVRQAIGYLSFLKRSDFQQNRHPHLCTPNGVSNDLGRSEVHNVSGPNRVESFFSKTSGSCDFDTSAGLDGGKRQGELCAAKPISPKHS